MSLIKKYLPVDTYSEEGIVDTIINFFKQDTKNIFQDKKQKDIIEILEKSFLNDSWLNKQKFSGGTVNATEISKYLFKDGLYKDQFLQDIKNHLQEVKNFIKNNIQTAKDYDKFIQEKDEELRSNFTEDESFLKIVEKVNNQISTKEKNIKLKGSLDESKLLYPISITGNFVKANSSSSSKTKVLPKLNKEQVKDAANLVIKLFNDSDWMPIGTDHSDGSDFNTKGAFYDSAEYHLYYELTYSQSVDSLLQNFYSTWYYFSNYQKTIKALLTWIEESVK